MVMSCIKHKCEQKRFPSPIIRIFMVPIFAILKWEPRYTWFHHSFSATVIPLVQTVRGCSNVIWYPLSHTFLTPAILCTVPHIISYFHLTPPPHPETAHLSSVRTIHVLTFRSQGDMPYPRSHHHMLFQQPLPLYIYMFYRKLHYTIVLNLSYTKQWLSALFSPQISTKRSVHTSKQSYVGYIMK